MARYLKSVAPSVDTTARDKEVRQTVTAIIEDIAKRGDAAVHELSRRFDKFDREAQFVLSRGRTLASLLDEFAARRADSLRQLEALQLTEADLEKHGTHPFFGRVTMRQPG